MESNPISEKEYVAILTDMSKDWSYGEAQREAMFDALAAIQQGNAVTYFRTMRNIMRPYLNLMDEKDVHNP